MRSLGFLGCALACAATLLPAAIASSAPVSRPNAGRTNPNIVTAPQDSSLPTMTLTPPPAIRAERVPPAYSVERQASDEPRRWESARPRDDRPRHRFRRPYRAYVVPGGFMGPRYAFSDWGGDRGDYRQGYGNDPSGIDWDRYETGPVPAYVGEGDPRDRDEDERYDEYFDRGHGADYASPPYDDGYDGDRHGGQRHQAEPSGSRVYALPPGGTMTITISGGTTTTTTIVEEY